MLTCKDSDTATSATLQTNVDPCPLKAGFTAPDYSTDLENRRSTKLYNVDVLSRSLHNWTDIDGGPDVICSYTVITKAGGRKRRTHSLTMNSGSSGQTEEISTTATFNDELLPHSQETLGTVCVFDIP